MIWIINTPRNYPATYGTYYDQFNFYDGRKEWEESIATIPEPAVHLFCVHWLHLEVSNGGFEQYFWNSTGTTAPEALAGYQAIGMPDVVDVVRAAMDRLQTPYPCEESDREDLLSDENLEFDFDDLDRRFFDLADTEKFFRRRPKFVPYAEQYAKVAIANGLLPKPEGWDVL